MDPVLAFGVQQRPGLAEGLGIVIRFHRADQVPGAVLEVGRAVQAVGGGQGLEGLVLE